MNGLDLLERAGAAANDAEHPESALRALLSPVVRTLEADTLKGGDTSGTPDPAQFFVAGAFVVAPDQAWHMLVGNIGFPREQERLMIPIEAGHPGRVRASRRPLHLPDTEAAGQFKQYLKTARMGSSIYAPMLWQGAFLGQIVLAARRRGTLDTGNFALMRAAAPLAAALWVAKGGEAWLHAAYPPANGFRVDPEGF